MKIWMQIEITLEDGCTKDDAEDIAQLEDLNDSRIDDLTVIAWQERS